MAKTLSYAQWQQRVFRLHDKAQAADDAYQRALDAAGEYRYGTHRTARVKSAYRRKVKSDNLLHVATQKMRAAESRGNSGGKMALKFGSKAWRAKYLKNAGKKRKTKRKTTARRKPAKRKTAKRRNTPVRNNPPRKWTKVKAVRVKRVRGRDILEIRK